MDTTTMTGDELVQAHKSATRKMRIVSVLFPVVFITLIVMNLISIVRQVHDIDSGAVGSELSDRVNTILPEINSSVGEVADAVQPALTHALEAESLAVAPQIEERLQKDVDRTIASAKHDLQMAADRSMTRAAAGQRALLIKEFPQLANNAAAQDQVLASIRRGLDDWETRQLDATVAEHVGAMEQLRATLQSSYTKPSAESADPEDALMTWLNLMNEHVGGEQKILGGDDKAAKPTLTQSVKK